MTPAEQLTHDLMNSVANLGDDDLDCIAGLSQDRAIARSAVLSGWLRDIVAAERVRRTGETVPFPAVDFHRIKSREASDLLLSSCVLLEGVVHIPRALDLAVQLSKFAAVIFGARLQERETMGNN